MQSVSERDKCPWPRCIRIGIAFAAFPVTDIRPYKYFLLLLNQLQNTCEFEIFDAEETDPFILALRKSVRSPGFRWLPVKTLDGEQARDGLEEFGQRMQANIANAVEREDLAVEPPDQIILVTGVTLSDYHFLIRRSTTTMLALGQWYKFMAPPSLAEFLQLLVLRAPYSAVEGAVWNSIHLGTRACIFDYTENLENTRYMALAGVGVCRACAAALQADGFKEAPAEIRRVAAREWRGDEATAGSPANIMARLRYDLFLTKGFEPGAGQRLRRFLTDDAVKEFVKFIFALLLAWLLFKAEIKT